MESGRLRGREKEFNKNLYFCNAYLKLFLILQKSIENWIQFFFCRRWPQMLLSEQC